MNASSGLCQWIHDDKRQGGKVNILHALLIRRLVADGRGTYAQIGAMFGLSQSYVSHTMLGILHTKVPGHKWFFSGIQGDLESEYRAAEIARNRRELLSATRAYGKVKKWLKER